MARTLPGLTPQRDSTVAGGGRREPRLIRTSQPQIAPRQITAPVAQPVDTYAPTPAPQGAGDGFFALAQGLRDFSPVLARFADDQMDKAKQAEEARAEARIGGMTLDEQNRFIKSGEIKNWEGPFARAKFMQLYGENAGTAAALELVRQYESGGFDKMNGNLDEFIAQGQAAGLAEVGDDPFAQRQYARSFRQIADRLRPMNAQDKAQQFAQDSADLIAGRFISIRTQMQADGSYTPQAYAERVRAEMTSNAKLNVMGRADQDRVLMGVIGRLADEGDEATVNFLLDDDRGGVGALGNKRENLADAVQLKERARSRRVELTQRAMPDQMAPILAAVDKGTYTAEQAERDRAAGLINDEQRISLVARSDARAADLRAANAKAVEKLALANAADASRQSARRAAWGIAAEGRGALISDVKVLNDSGEEVNYSRADQIRDTVQTFQEASNRLAQADNWSPAQKAQYDADWFAKNGFEDDQTQAVLSSAYSSVRSVDVEKGTVSLGRLQDAYEAYSAVYQMNPKYAQNGLLKGSRERAFYDDIRVGMEYGGLTFDQAATQAIQLSRLDRRGSANLTLQERNEVREAGDRITLRAQPETAFGRLWWGEEGIVGPVHNTGDVRRQIEELAFRNMDLGLSPTKAVEVATQQFATSHLNVNGYAVRANARAYPADIGARLTKRLRALYEDDGADLRDEYDFDDLTVVQDGASAGRWIVIDRSGLPISDPARRYITMDSIRADMREEAAKERQEIIDETVRLNGLRQDFRRDMSRGNPGIIPPPRDFTTEDQQ
ncbi:hypothetical protein KXR53_01475 [Inquilinus limosus]|uniref:hypothetical protein n=1 Tax=Inquilinus limosus TaxID=171674 RepID=UPI003F163F2E